MSMIDSVKILFALIGTGVFLQMAGIISHIVRLTLRCYDINSFEKYVQNTSL